MYNDYYDYYDSDPFITEDGVLYDDGYLRFFCAFEEGKSINDLLITVISQFDTEYGNYTDVVDEYAVTLNKAVDEIRKSETTFGSIESTFAYMAKRVGLAISY